MAFVRAAAWAIVLATAADAMRKRRQAANAARPDCPTPQQGRAGRFGDVGEVDWLYSFGAPGPSSPALQHQRNKDGVFPGLRTWNEDNGWTDMVATITSHIWMWQPLMRGEVLEPGLAPRSYAATVDTAGKPKTAWVNTKLHAQEEYQARTRVRGCERWNKYTDVANNISYATDVDEAERCTAMFGWTIFGAAYYDGKASVIGGYQVSYLVQEPDSLECVLTFQGTQSKTDWFSNLAFRPGKFCGLVEEDEECGLFGFGTCKVRNPRGSFVHWGFAEHLRKMVRVDEWQQSIRSQLGQCSAVYVTGHSLGGAAAALFTACISTQLQPGDFGFEDYDMMSWRKGSPGRLNKALVPFPQ